MTQSRTKPRTGGLGTWVLDQRGSPLIEFVLVLPLFLILVFGSFAVWKIVSAKQTLASGTYQAARYLSVEGRYLLEGYPRDWEVAARTIITSELKNNSLLRPLPQLTISFEPEPPTRPERPERHCTEDRYAVDCLRDALFTVQAVITLPWTAHIPFLDPETITLEEKRTSYIEYEPIFEPPPTPTPTPTPTPAP